MVPADGWYEWMTSVQGKVPWYHHRMDGGTCWLGGIWETWSSPSGDHIESFALVTVDANDDVNHVHHRMPLLLESEAIDGYLAGADHRGQPGPMLVESYAVGREVNSAKHDGAHLIRPVPTLW